MVIFYRKLFGLFSRREKLLILLFGLLNVIGSFLEVLGIGAIIPIIAILTNPELLEKNIMLSKLKSLVALSDVMEFVLILTVFFVFIIFFKNIFLFIIGCIQSKFLNNKCRAISLKLFTAYIRSPYSFHLSKNTASLQQHTECVGAVVNGLMFPAVIIFTEALVMTAIIFALLCIDILSTAFVSLSFAFMMGIFYLLARRKLKRWGATRNYHRAKVIQQINQGLCGIKETKMLHKEDYFINQYIKHVAEIVTVDYREKVLLQLPRLYIETITVILLTGVMLYFVNYGNDLRIFIIKLSLFAIAAVRIMPSCVRISTSMSTMRIYLNALDILVEDLKIAEHIKIHDERNIENCDDLVFVGRINLKGIAFSYEGNGFAIDEISLEIRRRQSVAFVGPTGAGKTTVVDIITGLLTPSSGTVEIDGVDIHRGLMSWQKQIGYVPQNIYLTDDTIKANVAFGVDEHEIDADRLKNALSMAQLGDFIGNLPEGVNTFAGERGIRISGGERQRIGIARALYHGPEVLILDEATSSLDNETERAFMETVRNLSGKKTIIIIAHRLTTVQHCDKIFFLKEGRLVAEGSYNELLEKCPDFARMAGVSSRSGADSRGWTAEREKGHSGLSESS